MPFWEKDYAFQGLWLVGDMLQTNTCWIPFLCVQYLFIVLAFKYFLGLCTTNVTFYTFVFVTFIEVHSVSWVETPFFIEIVQWF